MKKRSYSLKCLLLILLLCVPIFAFSANAETGMSFAGATVTADPGSVINYNVTISGNPGIAGYHVYLYYDSSVLSPVLDDGELALTPGSRYSGKGSYSTRVDDSGYIEVLWYYSKNVDVNGTLFAVPFTVNANASAGTYPITVRTESKNNVNDSYAVVEAACVDGSVTVTGTEPPIDPDEPDDPIVTQEMTITGAQVSGEVGANIEYSVSVSDNPGIAGYHVTLQYDSSVLTPVEDDGDLMITLGNGFNKGSCTTRIGDGEIEVLWYYSRNVSVDGKMFTIGFKAADTADAGTYPITVSTQAADNVDEALKKVPAKTVNGSVTLEKVDTDAAVIEVGAVQGRNGKDITVPVTISQNPGIAGFGLKVKYDTSILTLKSIRRGDLTEDGTFSVNGDSATWYAVENVTVDGVIANLVFTIAPEAPKGTTEVSVELLNGKLSNLADEQGTPVPARFVTGVQTITRGLLGDLNGDDEIAIADVIKLNRYVLGLQTLTPEEQDLADVTGDGEIAIADVIKLNRFVLGIIEYLEDMPSTASNAGQMTISGRTASQNDSMTVYVESVEAGSDGKAIIPVRIENNTGIAGLGLEVTLDEGLTLKSIKKGELLQDGTFSVYRNAMTWYHTENIAEDGVLFYIEVAADDCKPRTISVERKDGKLSNAADVDGRPVNISFISGTASRAHAEFTEHSEVKGTCTVEGSMEYYTCGSCGGYFALVDGKYVPIAENSWIVPARGYHVFDGNKTCANCGTIIDLDTLKVMRLPDVLTEIEDEAFMNAAMEVIMVPENCKRIGERAFADCVNLKYIFMRGDIESIAENAFEDCNAEIVYW